MANKIMGPKGLEVLKYYEGFRDKAYLCPANVWTIGYGTTKNVRPGMTVTRDQAEAMLAMDLLDFEAAVNSLVKVSLTQTQFDALVCFTYNVGIGAFKSSTLLKKLNQGAYDEVPAQLNRWNMGGGKVLAGLVKRRTTEGVLFSQGYVNYN